MSEPVACCHASLGRRRNNSNQKLVRQLSEKNLALPSTLGPIKFQILRSIAPSNADLLIRSMRGNSLLPIHQPTTGAGEGGYRRQQACQVATMQQGAGKSCRMGAACTCGGKCPAGSAAALVLDTRHCTLLGPVHGIWGKRIGIAEGLGRSWPATHNQLKHLVPQPSNSLMADHSSKKCKGSRRYLKAHSHRMARGSLAT